MRLFLWICITIFLKHLYALERPNVVMIISDDQTWTDFGFMGHPHVKTPHLDQLAKDSALFDNAYVPSSVCRPSLVTILTGLYPHEHGVTYNHGPPGNSNYNKMESVAEYEKTRQREFLNDSIMTLPKALGQVGYRSLQTGKFWEGPYHRSGFTHGMTLFKPVPGQDYGGNRTLRNGVQVAHGNGDWGLKIGRETMKPIYEFIADVEKESQPWMVWYAPYLPHQPHDSPERFRKSYLKMDGVEPHQIPYYASITHFDETVGALVKNLKHQGVYESTLIIFVVDNGWSPSKKMMTHKNGTRDYAKRKTSKRAPFDEGVRTPIFFHWPTKIKPKRYRELVSSVDIMPTILDLCQNHDQQFKMSGVSLRPTLLNEEPLNTDRAVFGELYPGDASILFKAEKDIAYRWVRKGNYKLIVPHFHNKKQAWNDYLDSEALFDLKNDPFEKNNLIDQPEYKHHRENLTKLLVEWWNP